MTTTAPHQLPHLAPILDRWQSSLLDPATVPSGRPPAAPTVYRTADLIVHPTDPATDQRVRAALTRVLAQRAWSGEQVAAGVRLHPGSSTVEPVDAWSIVAELRADDDPDVAAGVGLDHLLTTAEQPGGNPFALGRGRVGLDDYGVPGYGGRGPVNFVTPAPPAPGPGRRPRVVVLDTGIGEHPWFQEHPAQTIIALADGRTVGPQIDPASIRGIDADASGAIADVMLGALATHSGHGTFIAGLIRQACPEANIVALAVMGSDGIVAESTLTDALNVIADRQREEPEWADAVVLSLGYYAETAQDVSYNTALKQILLELGRLGIAVFCAAGNDASSRPSYPAAFAVDPGFADQAVVPLVSVAALNPDGSVALFSNDGDWVTAEAAGVNLVSTAPIGMNGSAQPEFRMSGPGGRPRGAPDPDDFDSGFAAWSGTSFAAPVLAGTYLRALIEAGFPPITQRRALVPVGRNRTNRLGR